MPQGGLPENDIILVTVDSLQYDYIADGDGPSANLEGLRSISENGVFFTNAFSNAGITKASFLSIFSGTFPWMFDGLSGGFGTQRPHLAKLLSDAGYATAGFNTNPYLSTTYGYDRGFDYYMGRDTEEAIDQTTFSSKYWPTIKENIPSKHLARKIRSVYGSVGERLGIQLGGDPYVPAEQVNEAVLQWVEKTAGPRFIWIHYMDVHTPYYPRKGTVSEGISKRRAIKLFHKANKLRDQTSERELEELRQLYKGEVVYLDQKFNELLEELDSQLNLEQSLLIFGSDHGESFGAHDSVFHPDGVLYDPQVHVPLIIRAPECSGETVSTPVSNVDILPTALDWADTETPSVCVGDSVFELISDPPEERVVFAGGHGQDTGIAMAVSGKYKLIRDLESGSESLYDRYQDPTENRNCLSDEPVATDTLQSALEAHLEMVRNHDSTAEEVEVDDEIKMQLRMLGYSE